MGRDPFPLASRYDERWAASLSFGENVLYFAEAAARGTIPPGASVLDAGCGTGLSSAFLARHFGAIVTGCDLVLDNQRAHAIAGELGVSDKVTFLRGDVFRRLTDARFDFVLCLDSVYDIAVDDAGIGRLANFLKPGGRLIIVEDAFERPVGLEDVPMEARSAWEGEYQMVLTVEGMVERLERAGLRCDEAGFLAEAGWIAGQHARRHADDPGEASVIAFQAAMPVGAARWVATQMS